MPLMNRDEHENLLNELLQPDLEQSRRTEILQALRVDHSTGHQDYEEITKTNSKLKKNNDDLIISNSQLFRKLGTMDQPAKKEEEEKKTFSESITVSAIEKGV